MLPRILIDLGIKHKTHVNEYAKDGYMTGKKTINSVGSWVSLFRDTQSLEIKVTHK
jgi:hypothetical protein